MSKVIKIDQPNETAYVAKGYCVRVHAFKDSEDNTLYKILLDDMQELVVTECELLGLGEIAKEIKL